MTKTWCVWSVLVVVAGAGAGALAASGCSDDAMPPTDGGGTTGDGGARIDGSSDDGGATVDGGVRIDGAIPDGGAITDGEVADAGATDGAVTRDGGTTDGGASSDAGATDGGSAGPCTCTPTEACIFETPLACGGPFRCVPRSVICPAIYAPVCGCDGVTYSSACNARGAGVDYGATGECEVSD